MAAVLLMTPAYLKRHGLVDENVDDSYITPIIELCQDTFVQEILGTGLYNEIKTQIAAGSVSALNQTLLDDKVLAAMKWWVTSKVIKRTTYKLSNQGVKVFESENYVTPDSSIIGNLEEEYMNAAEYYANAATMYLIENSTLYPLYDNPGDGIDTVIPNRNQFKSGIFLGGRRKIENLGVDIFMGDRWHVKRRGG